jgi:hypothetical protein
VTIVTKWLAIWHNGVNVMARDRMLQFFEYAHLRQDLQGISRPFGELAEWVVNTLPQNPERTVALRKLLEAKDCAVRSTLYREGDETVSAAAGTAGQPVGAQAVGANPVG